MATLFTLSSYAQQREAYFVSSPYGKITFNNTKGTPDTLASHFGGTPTLFRELGGGYPTGHDSFDDLSKMQLFDATYGLSSVNGSITDLLFWFGHAEGNPSSIFKATIWADNAGEPGAILATENVLFSAIDTAVANLNMGSNFAWNAKATFATPVAIPASQKFWAGIEVIFITGDSLGLMSTNDQIADAPGLSGDFPDAITYTFEEWSDNSFHSFNDGTNATWQIDIALGVFPVMDYTVGVNEIDSENELVLSPNPNNGQFTLTTENTNNLVEIYNLVGEKVFSNNLQSKTSLIDISNQPKGIYLVKVTSGDVVITQKLVYQ